MHVLGYLLHGLLDVCSLLREGWEVFQCSLHGLVGE